MLVLFNTFVACSCQLLSCNCMMIVQFLSSNFVVHLNKEFKEQTHVITHHPTWRIYPRNPNKEINIK